MSYENVDCIKEVTVLETTWTNCPKEVVDDVRELWAHMDLGNDFFYFSWDEESWWDEEDKFVNLKKYLKERGIKKCLIHFWW